MRSIYFEKNLPKIIATLALKKIWQGAIYTPIAPIAYQDLPEPNLPGPRGIKVKNRVCGICASDIHLLFVDVDPKVHPAALPANDRIYLGHEVCSEVTEIGPGVSTLAVGDRVLMKSRFMGSTCHSKEIEPLCRHCETGNYCLCLNRCEDGGIPGIGGGWGDGYSCHETEVWKAPTDLTDDQVALIEPLACSVRAVLRKQPKKNQNVLVIGCGIIGLGIIQAVKAIEPTCNVYAAARYPQQKNLAKSWGAHIANTNLFETAKQVAGAKNYQGDFDNKTALGGFDIVYDCVGTDTTIEQSLRLARSGGTVMLVGVHLHRVKADLTPIWHEEIDLIGEIAHGAEQWQGQTISTYDLTAKFIRE
ncbi:(R,R)-butanediol dehydrogenase-like, partial [Ylistrum balloti]|uniref:(R,R)-butanediol dehydrogenase-like n=1 Tax=Ylistrum balloti TaxID=509963 RepID=UPI002905982F